MIAVDICNTLANVASELKKLGIEQDTYPSPLPESFFSSPKGLRVFRNAKPFEGAKYMIIQLSKIYGGVTYVTTRPKEARPVTRRWLSENGFPSGKIIFCKWQEKPDIYTKLNPCIIIEDDPRVLDSIKDRKVLVLVPQWSYNNHINGKGIVPCGWKSNWH